MSGLPRLKKRPGALAAAVASAPAAASTAASTAATAAALRLRLVTPLNARIRVGNFLVSYRPLAPFDSHLLLCAARQDAGFLLLHR